MDRNTLIALVFILAIWLLWPKWTEFLYGEQPEPVPATATGARADSSLAPQDIPIFEPTDRGMTLTAPDPARGFEPVDVETAVEPTLVTVETNLYVATLTSKGATLREWRLRNFREPDSSAVQLIAPDGRAMGLRIGPQGQEVDMRDRVFSVESPQTHYTLTAGETASVRFVYRGPDGRAVRKEWTFHGDKYTIEFFAGFDRSPEIDKLVLTWHGEVPAAEGEVAIQREMPMMSTQAMVGGSLEALTYSDEPETTAFVGLTDWIGARNKYFMAAFAPEHSDQAEVRLMARGYGENRPVYGWSYSPYDMTRTEIRGLLYMGPIDVDLLTAAGHELDQAADLGWSVIRPISKVVLWSFLGLHKIIPNYGWIIVIFSIAVKIILHPLTKKSYENTSKMQKLKPHMDEIREKFKSDSQKVNQEMMKLYKEHGFNPLGGCLPMLLQMPIIFAIYAVLSNNIEFRQQPFILWITDLSAPDTIYTLAEALPIYGKHINILPVLMSVSMFFQQKHMLTDPKQKMMVNNMPVIMLVIINSISSGLVLYWFMFNILSAGHQYLMVHRKNQADGTAALEAPGLSMKNPTKARRK